MPNLSCYMDERLEERDTWHMKRKRNLSIKWYNRVEKIIYECLGIKLFRKCVFLLERFIHRKDKGRNINYHFAKNSLSDVAYFTRYLFYNGAIHVRNIGYAITYLLVRQLFSATFGFVDAVVLALSMKDIYCIMLQRYNYLRINERIAVLKEKETATLAIGFKECTDLRQTSPSARRISNGYVQCANNYRARNTISLFPMTILTG